MSALEIVLTCATSALAIVLFIYIIVNVTIKKFETLKSGDFQVFDKFAPKGETVFLGDSLTDFFPLHEFEYNRTVINRGIAGDTTDDVLNRIDEVTALKPSVLFLQIGINDLLQKKSSPERVVENIMKIIANFDKKTDIHVISLYPINVKKMTYNRFLAIKCSNETVKTTNSLLKSKLEENGYDFIYVFDKLTDSFGNLKEEYTVDGLHLSALGYEVLFNVYGKIIEKNETSACNN